MVRPPVTGTLNCSHAIVDGVRIVTLPPLPNTFACIGGGLRGPTVTITGFVTEIAGLVRPPHIPFTYNRRGSETTNVPPSTAPCVPSARNSFTSISRSTITRHPFAKTKSVTHGNNPCRHVLRSDHSPSRTACATPNFAGITWYMQARIAVIIACRRFIVSPKQEWSYGDGPYFFALWALIFSVSAFNFSLTVDSDMPPGMQPLIMRFQ